MILEIIKYPDPRLKLISERINEINNDIRNFAQDLIETMIAANGAGLAAIQVNRAIKMIAIINNDLNNLIDSQQFPVAIMINPEITYKSEKEVKGTERCLSFGDLRKRISRSEEVEVEYFNLQGKKIKVRLSGRNGRILQHELDHLRGITLENYNE